MEVILRNLIRSSNFIVFRCSTTMTSSFGYDKSYESALSTLNGLQSNAITLEREKLVKQEEKFAEMKLYLYRLGLKLEEIDKLNIIHVSGTKGKGSTCAFTESILRAHGFKTGFFSSPHIVEVKERIRINGKPLAAELFTKYFWDCYLPLITSKDLYGTMPAYFRFLTLMALHTFLQEKVDVAILEVGIGGQYDCTNIIKNPVVCGISSLGMDHMNILGTSIETIAWNKAGIFKKGVPAVTVPQKEEAMAVLHVRAREIGSPMYLASQLHISSSMLGIPGAMQLQNASLAIQLSKFWLENHSKSLSQRLQDYQQILISAKELPIICKSLNVNENTLRGLSLCQWPGRCQIVKSRGTVFYLDGAHTEESIEACVKWFQQECHIQGRQCLKALWFNSTGDRQPETLIKGLLTCNFDLALFTPNIQKYDSPNNSDLIMKKMSTESQIKRSLVNRAAWLKMNENLAPLRDELHIAQEKQSTLLFSSIFDALQWLEKNKEREIHILCTGSLHLIGGILSFIDPDVCNK